MKKKVEKRLYQSLLNMEETEYAIKQLKDFFEKELANSLNLRRITAPLFVLEGTGINDDLNGYEKPVQFFAKSMQNQRIEMVQSLAKWKRLQLKRLSVKPQFGIYTDMNAIRPDEELSCIHSIYVDQWDWEKTILQEQRNVGFLKGEVNKIYAAIKATETYLYTINSALMPALPKEIHFIHAQELLDRFPHQSAKEREWSIAKEYGAVFIYGIGGKLSNGEPHDGRAPDYDDWSSLSEEGRAGLNGDIVVWNSVLQSAFELSSMGIRVDRTALLLQLKACNQEQRLKLPFHSWLANNDLPLSIGGGIGQSRLCMFLLKKKHIGEVQSSLWPEEYQKKLASEGIMLL